MDPLAAIAILGLVHVGLLFTLITGMIGGVLLAL